MEQRLSDNVSWSSLPVPRWRRALRWLPTLADAALLVLGSAGSPLSRPRAADPRLAVGREDVLGRLTVSGTSGGMPDRYPSMQVVAVHRDRAVITPGATDRVLPLRDLTVVEARRVGVPWTRRKAVDASWTVRVEGAGTDLVFRGSWLLLAHLGTLGGWPEPKGRGWRSPIG